MPIKLVARKNFDNNPLLNVPVKGPDGKPQLKHPRHIHKGFRFDFGPASVNVYEDLNSKDKETLQALVYSRSVTIVEDTAKSKAIIAKIDSEVAEENAADDAFNSRLESSRPATVKDLVEVLGSK